MESAGNGSDLLVGRGSPGREEFGGSYAGARDRVELVLVARQSSKRLPLKHLYPLYEMFSVLDVLMMRIAQASGIERFTFAVPYTDRLYAEIGEANGWRIYMNRDLHESDVLGRIDRATHGAERVVIVWGDSPLTCPRLIERLLAIRADLVTTSTPGLRPIVVRKKLLSEWNGRIRAELEHPLSMLLKPVGHTQAVLELGSTRKLAIDTLQDLKFVRSVIQKVGGFNECYEEYLAAAALCSDPDVR